MKRCPRCNGMYQGSPDRCPLDGAALEPCPDQNLGREIQGWRLHALVASGALACVYQVERDGQRGALKLYAPSAPVEVQRATRESAAHARLRHPRIAALLDHGTTGAGEVFLVTELVAGPTLREQLDRGRGAMRWSEAVRLSAQVCEGLDVIHASGLVHRDLKPENLIVQAGPDGPSIKILDLGHALLMDVERLTQSGMVWGSAAYMSPEQAAAMSVDARSDLYSLGVILYEMLVGRRPFDARAALDIMQMHRGTMPVAPAQLADIPAQVSDMCLWLLSKQPRQRPPSARVAGAVLQGLEVSAAQLDGSAVRGAAAL